MNNIFIMLHSILNNVLKDKVFYGTNQLDNGDSASLPFIIYNERSKRGIAYSDNQARVRQSIIQVTLMTNKKDIELEEMLENEFEINNIEYQMVTEFTNYDNSVNRIYEVKMEVIK